MTGARCTGSLLLEGKRGAEWALSPCASGGGMGAVGLFEIYG